jgi:hypothetical protein
MESNLTAVQWLEEQIDYISIEELKTQIIIAKEMEKQQQGYSEGDMLKSFHCGKLYQGREGHIYFEQLINKLKNK